MGCSCGSVSTAYEHVDGTSNKAASSRRRASSGRVASGRPSPALPAWTLEQGDMLQRTLDRIFSEGSKEAPSRSMSFTIADPLQEGCPLVGCSSGFRSLCGYELHEILGRNCRFLVDPVPRELVDDDVRLRARSFCELAARPRDKLEERPAELLCVQVNARKCGALFRNMFYLRVVSIGGQPYVVGLQAELPSPKEEAPAIDAWQGAFDRLLANMAEVERIFAGPFWREYNGLRWSPHDLKPNNAQSEASSLENFYLEKL